MEATGTRVTHVIGDVGGQREALEELLERLGVVVDERWIPVGTTVVQVGDLVHRGPDSDGVVGLVDELMHHNPGRWVQLMGNHEAQYCVERAFEWREEIGERARDTLRRWWETGEMRLAHAVEAADVLVTHAGLTVGCWEDLGGPAMAVEAAGRVNDAGRGSCVWNHGVMLGGEVRRDAGVLWAEAGREVLVPWCERGALPFSIVHGHSSAFAGGTGRWREEQVRETVTAAAEVELRRGRISEVRLGERAVWGVDPGHGAVAVTWEALSIAGE